MIEVIANKFNVMKNELKLEILKGSPIHVPKNFSQAQNLFLYLSKNFEKVIFKHTLPVKIIEKTYQIIFYRSSNDEKSNKIRTSEKIQYKIKFY